MPTLEADTMQTQLIKKGTPRLIVVYRRPILSANIPAGRAPKNAPTAKKEPIHDSREQKEISFIKS